MATVSPETKQVITTAVEIGNISIADVTADGIDGGDHVIGVQRAFSRLVATTPWARAGGIGHDPGQVMPF